MQDDFSVRQGPSPVCSYNGWDPLEEVILGTARGAVKSEYEPGLSPFLPLDSPQRRAGGARFSQEEVDRAEEQLDQFADLLRGRGIVVRRPEPLDQAYRVQTPDFECRYGHAQACPRDVLLVVGDEIIEASMSQRARYFEYRAYRPLLKRYFLEGARWTAAPKATMSDELYVAGYETESAPFDLLTHPSLTECEPCFDAACFCRMGRDIFWQPDIASNQLGAAWLQRHLGPRFRLHRVEFHHPYPHHIDTTLVPLRPGLLLICPDRPPKRDSLRIFAENGWQTIQAPPPIRARTRESAWHVSSWISLNILSLDENTVVVEASETPLIAELERYGFDVVACPFRSVLRFGGSFHCCTVDIRRRGTLQCYFPTISD